MADLPRAVRATLLALGLLAPLWWCATPLYNRYLLTGAENLLHFFERPDSTDLVASGRHDAPLVRRDLPNRVLHTFRVTDLHFSAVLAGALLLATPAALPLGRRLKNLALSALVIVPFHLVLLLSLVLSVYALRLGDWSLSHYSPFSRNALALAGHLLQLPFKLALPVFAWAAFSFSQPSTPTGAPHVRKRHPHRTRRQRPRV